MKTKEEFVIEDVFNKWAGDLRTEFSDIRYLHKERPELLENLFGMFKSSGISFDDAKDYRNKAMLELTTLEGRKGAGKYKGWKQTTEKDYDTILASYYVDVEVQEDLKPKIKSKEKSVSTEDYYPDSIMIREWSMEKWGDSWTEELSRECHMIGGAFNIMFMQEAFESGKLSSNNNLPDWYKLAFNLF